jgi:hypothetical protein
MIEKRVVNKKRKKNQQTKMSQTRVAKFGNAFLGCGQLWRGISMQQFFGRENPGGLRRNSG